MAGKDDGSKQRKPRGKRDRIVERDEKRHWQWRRTLVDRMVGTADRALLAKHVERARHQRGRMHAFERRVDVRRPLEGAVEVLGGQEVKVRARPGKNPSGDVGFGGTGTFVEVRADGAFAAATLRFALDKEPVTRLEPETILVARWDDRQGRFRLVPQSGFDAQEGFAFARVTRPGLYTAVGIPHDPRIRTTLQLLRAVRPWAGLGEKFDLMPKICQLILCSPELDALVQDFVDGGGGFETTEFGRGDFGGGFGGFGGQNVCEFCLGIGGPGGIVELDILDVLELPPYVVRPWRVPPIWPWPCPGWTSIGPSNVPGRISALAIDPGDGDVVYAGGAAGGVFKTLNAGGSWSAQWSGQLSLAIGGLAVAPSNSGVLYAATGEWEGNVGAANNHFPGVGVYRSGNGGGDWDLLAPIPSTNAAAVAVDPTNSNRVFVAGDTSLHRSADGGATWDVTPGNVNGIFDGTISDVIIDPDDANRVYIGVHNSGVWRSTDRGATWTQLTSGIATGSAASSPKIALGRDGANGTRFVAVKMARRVFTSTDGGTAFTEQANCDVDWSPYYPWANVIAVDPTDEDILFGGHASLFRSTDGGASWTKVGGYSAPPVHPDQQAVVFDPDDHDHVYVATDGGVYESTDNGQTWVAKSTNLVTTQCWTAGVAQGATLAYGVTTQDNACYEWTGGNNFNEIRGPEGGWIEYDPQDSNVVYADTWFADLSKSSDGGTTWTDLGINTDSGHSEGLSIARGTPNRLLAILGGGQLRRSTNGGTAWTTPTGIPASATLSAVQFAPSDDNHAYAAGTTGRVWHSADGGATWTELPNMDLPAARVHDVEVDPADPLRVYLAFGALGIRQLWRGEVTAANDATWFDVGGASAAVSLPDLALTGLALDPTYEETIYAANILGVYRTTDGGESWAPFDEGLPNCFVSDLDLRVNGRALYASTMGRGLYRRVL